LRQSCLLKEQQKMRTTYLALVLSALIGWSIPASAQSYKYQITPYLWLAGLDGAVGARNRTVDVDASPRNVLDNLDLAGMGAFEARLDRWRILTDVLYVDISDQGGRAEPPFVTATVAARTFIFDQEAGYQLLKREGTDLDATAGIRYWNLKNQLRLGLNANSLALEHSHGWVDPVVGVRFISDLPMHLYVTGKADVGGFSTAARLDWQAFGGVGYRFTDHIVANIGYRNLSVDYKNDGFVFDTGMRGAVLGLGLRF